MADKNTDEFKLTPDVGAKTDKPAKKEPASKKSSTKDTTKKKSTKKGGKGKKKDLRARNISSALIPIEEETWLVQPIAVTMMRHDYSLLQIRILVSGAR